MEASLKTVSVTEVQAHFLALLEEVKQTREPLVIADGHQAVAKLEAVSPWFPSKLPPLQSGEDPLAIFRFGGLKIVGDIVNTSTAEDWELD